VNPEEEVVAGEKGSCVSQSEVEKNIKEMRDKKAPSGDDAPGDVLIFLGKDGLKIMTQLISSIFGTAEWPKDFIRVK
jgi:hypothetical protein